MTITPSDEQTKAIETFFRWFRSRDREQPWFYLAGYAGTGKTTLAKIIAAEAGGNVRFAAYTGKAASVLRRKGCHGASTIHRLIYKPAGENDDRPTFIKRDHADLGDIDLLIIDECSMVNDRLAKDLLSFDRPILVLGDPAQLPPVKGEGYFTERDPDFLLTSIHRQAEGSPILRLATMARGGKYIPLCTLKGENGTAGIAQVTKWADVSERSKLSAHQIIVGTNNYRISVNRSIREAMQANGSLPRTPADVPWMPVVGDKVICLRNKHARGLLNGAMWRVDDSHLTRSQKTVVMEISSLDDDTPHMTVEVPSPCFSGDKTFKFATSLAQQYEEFTFGYAITAHKAQGSEWPNVLIRNQAFIFEDDRHRWLYTAITRASENLILAN